MVKIQQNLSKKVIFVTIIPKTFDFKSKKKKKKKICHVFLGLFTWNHPVAFSTLDVCPWHLCGHSRGAHVWGADSPLLRK